MSLYMLLFKPAAELYGCHPIGFFLNLFFYVYYLSFVFEARSVKQYLCGLSGVFFNYYI